MNKALSCRKYIVVAYACDPDGVAEAKVGWDWCKLLLESGAKVSIITSARDAPKLCSYGEEIEEPFHVHAVGKAFRYSSNRLLARLQVWFDYIKWCKKIPKEISDLEKSNGPCAVIHASFATWRVFPDYQRISGSLIFGPVGGGEDFPLRFASILSTASLAFELLRKIQTRVAILHLRRNWPFPKGSVIFASNPETKKIFENQKRRTADVQLLSQCRFSKYDLQHKFKFWPKKSDLGGKLNIFSAGNLEGRKGVLLTLKALKQCNEQGIDFEYIHAGKGPEYRHLQKWVNANGLSHRVTFCDPFIGDEYVKRLQQTHVYCLPSLRESAGFSMAEAMLCGAVPIVLDCGGPGWIVSEYSGYKIPVTSPAVVVEQIAMILEKIAGDPAQLNEKAIRARERIIQAFSDSRFNAQVCEKVYLNV